MTRFLDNFWDSDFNSTNGFEVLIKRMKDGRDMCKALEDLLKQRAKAEDAFGKNLQRMAKSAMGKEEIGGLKKSWDELLMQTEKMGNEHVSLATRLQDEAKRIEEFREAQKEKRRKPEDCTKKAQTVKKEWYNKVVQAKKTYEVRKRDLDQADDHYMKQRLVVTQQKELDKLTQKKERCFQAVEQADAQYHASVKSLEDARRDWEKQMEEFCVILQAMEEERIRFLRNMMWVQLNLVSQNCVEDDVHCEDGRKILEQCSEENDIKLFVAQKRTGSSRPAPIEMESYRGSQSKPGAVVAPNGRTPSPTVDGHRRRDPHTALPSIPSNTANPLINGGRRSLPRQPDDEHMQALQQSLMSTEALYAAVDPTPPQSNSGSNQLWVKSKFDYRAQGSKELNLSAGQILTVLNKNDMNWWTVEAQDGQRGMVPTQYLEPINLKTEKSIL